MSLTVRSKEGECWCAKVTFRVPMPLPLEAGGIRGFVPPVFATGGTRARWGESRLRELIPLDLEGQSNGWRMVS